MQKILFIIGDNFLYFLSYIGRMGIFLSNALLPRFNMDFRPRHTVKQIHVIGATSLFVIFLTAMFTGMVLALQGYYTLKKFGSGSLLGSAVALTIVRELGPVLTAFMVIARAGSAMCAEIGGMRISEQLDALEVMNIDHFSFLISPKLWAGIISIPLLVAFFDIVGIAGGHLVGVGLLGANSGAYISSIQHSLTSQDIMMGVYKSICFGLLMTWICCFVGYNVSMERRPVMGTKGVSTATTRSVVISSVSVLVFDFLISSIML